MGLTRGPLKRTQPIQSRRYCEPADEPKDKGADHDLDDQRCGIEMMEQGRNRDI